MKFKELELNQDGNRFKKLLKSKHIRKTFIYIVLGALLSVLLFYFTEGKHLTEITSGDIIGRLLIGGFFGFFITNSPCARGRC